MITGHADVRTDERRRAAAERAATRIAEANVEREDDFQDFAIGEIRLALDAFRHPMHDRQPGIEPDPDASEDDLPRRGENALLDALNELAREIDGSPDTIKTLCERVLGLAREEA
jgi:hypothetical protein